MTPLTPSQVAESLNLGRATVYRAIQDGELTAYKVRGQLRIEPEELEAFKQRNRVEPREQPGFEPPTPRQSPAGDTFAGELRVIRNERRVA